ncbi:hypothetical protein EIP91_011576, partial [Steccherinum ochraceum]
HSENPAESSPPLQRGHADGKPLTPPPGADPLLWELFTKINRSGTGHITLAELKQASIKGNDESWDLDSVKMLINIFDKTQSGTISYAEFMGLWKYVTDWKNCFMHFDKDRSGTLDGHELATAIRSFGYQLSPSIFSIIEQKYASGPVVKNGPPAEIHIDCFMRACVTVQTLAKGFQRLDTDQDGWVRLNFEDLLRIGLMSIEDLSKNETFPETTGQVDKKGEVEEMRDKLVESQQLIDDMKAQHIKEVAHLHEQITNISRELGGTMSEKTIELARAKAEVNKQTKELAQAKELQMKELADAKSEIAKQERELATAMANQAKELLDAKDR